MKHLTHPSALPMLLVAPLILAGCSPRGDTPIVNNDAAPQANMSNGNAVLPSDGRLPLTIRTAAGTHRFDVELAQTPAEHEHGLMGRQSLAADSGMLFTFVPPQTATFWMKDTPLSLDMLFIRADGTIAMVAANAKPNSLETISAGVPVIAVLEIAGGRAATLGIREGDRVNWGACAVADGAPRNDNSPILDFCPGT